MLKVKDKYDYRQELCEALRSGKYEKCVGSLGAWRTGDGPMCFEGLARFKLLGQADVSGFTGRGASLRDAIDLMWKKLGFGSEEIIKLVYDLNDRSEASFEDMAAYIEALS